MMAFNKAGFFIKVSFEILSAIVTAVFSAAFEY
jgi:hypothetical protein